MNTDVSAAPIRFAVLARGVSLEAWQTHCVDLLLALPGVRSNGQYTLNDIAQAKPADLDFILSFLDDPCPRELLDAPRHGMWRFQFGNWIDYRGPVPGFWEVYDDDAVTGALLTQVRADRNEVAVLREGYFRTQLTSYRGNREQLLNRVVRWPAQVCQSLRTGTHEVATRVLRTTAAPRAHPNGWQLLKCRWRTTTRMAVALYRSLFRHDQWNIAVVNQPIAAFLKTDCNAQIKWLPAQKSHEYRADPFGVQRDGRLIILCEHFSYRSNLGTIVSIEADGAATSPVTIGPDVHLSYPFILHTDGGTLCLPEASAASEVSMYAAEKFPDRWIKTGDLIKGVPIVDATPFRYGNRWWLAGSEIARKGANCELHLWYADNLAGPWLPHVANPVKTDIRSSRPAGAPFIQNDVLYRPAQDCSRTYGGKVVINRVMKLTPTEFHEEAVATVNPDPQGPYPGGLHTLSGVGNITLIDGKRSVFVFAELMRVLINAAGMIFRRDQHA